MPMPERRLDNSLPVGMKKKARDFNVKEVVEDKEPPQKIDSIDFSICSGEEIVRNAVMEVSRDDMYTTLPTAAGQPSVREAATHGPLDRRMGTTNKDSKCKTCDEFLTECAGHFGHLRLTMPVTLMSLCTHTCTATVTRTCSANLVCVCVFVCVCVCVCVCPLSPLPSPAPAPLPSSLCQLPTCGFLTACGAIVTGVPSRLLQGHHRLLDLHLQDMQSAVAAAK